MPETCIKTPEVVGWQWLLFGVERFCVRFNRTKIILRAPILCAWRRNASGRFWFPCCEKEVRANFAHKKKTIASTIVKMRPTGVQRNFPPKRRIRRSSGRRMKIPYKWNALSESETTLAQFIDSVRCLFSNVPYPAHVSVPISDIDCHLMKRKSINHLPSLAYHTRRIQYTRTPIQRAHIWLSVRPFAIHRSNLRTITNVAFSLALAPALITVTPIKQRDAPNETRKKWKINVSNV